MGRQHAPTSAPTVTGNGLSRLFLEGQTVRVFTIPLIEARGFSIVGTICAPGCLAVWGNDGAPMTKRLAKKLDDNRLGGHAPSPWQEPLPPYELDPMLDNPVIRNRIGELIAKAAEKRFGGWSLRRR
jgi:hypothetical protein